MAPPTPTATTRSYPRFLWLFRAANWCACWAHRVPQEGSIVIDDVTVATKELHVPPEQRRIGLMFQDYALFPHLNVIDNVSFGLLGMARAKARAIARERLDQVELAHLTEAFPHMLSGGMQQRVGIARALTSNSDFPASIPICAPPSAR